MILPVIDSNLAKEEMISFIKEIANKTNTDGIVIGLSGGIDSTIVAYLLKEAINEKDIYSYNLFTSTTPMEDIEHARLVAKILNINYKEIAIDTISNEFLNLVNNSDLTDNKTAQGNLKARIRMSFLYYFANIKNSLVVGTSNKSELLIGYFTKYGDGACDFEPIGGIYKTQLKKLAKTLNIPNEIIEKPPRAGLWKDQTDEDEIGFSYEVLDKLLYLIVDKNLNNEEIINEMDISSSEIDIVRNKIINNEHKLYPPLKFKIK